MCNFLFPTCYILNPEEISDSSKVGSIRHQVQIEHFRNKFKNVRTICSIPTRFVIKLHRERKTRLSKLYYKYRK